MSQIQWTISLVLAGLFAFAIIGFAVNFADDNNAPIDISNDNITSELYGNTSQDLGDFQGDAQITYESIVNSTIPPTAASGTFESAGTFSKTDSNVVGTTKNILKVGYVKIFGGGDGFGIFLSTMIGMIAFITGLLIYKTLRGGQPD